MGAARFEGDPRVGYGALARDAQKSAVADARAFGLIPLGGQSPVLPMTDSLGNKVNYFQVFDYDDEVFGAALQAITINPARHSGIEDRVGSIEVGKDADLVLTSGSPFDTDPAIQAVYIDGKKVE